MSEFNDRFFLTISGQSAPLHVAQLFGQEGLNELYNFELVLVATDAELTFDDVVDSEALLTIHGEDEGHRLVHGIISRFELGDHGEHFTLYRATLVPKVWKLQHRTSCRVFQDLSVADIVSKVLEDAGLEDGTDFRLALQQQQSPREYCVQYRESDWVFACRLLEDEGISYFFEHDEDSDKLVLCDSPTGYD